MGGLQATCRLGNKVEITFGEKRGVPLRAGNDPGPSGSVFRRTGHLPRPAGSCRWGPRGRDTAKPLSLPPAGPSATGQGGAGLPGTGTRGVSAHHPPRSLLGLGRGPRGCKNHTVSSTPAGGHYPSTFSLGPSSRVRNLFSSPFTSSFPKRAARRPAYLAWCWFPAPRSHEARSPGTAPHKSRLNTREGGSGRSSAPPGKPYLRCGSAGRGSAGSPPPGALLRGGRPATARGGASAGGAWRPSGGEGLSRGGGKELR